MGELYGPARGVVFNGEGGRGVCEGMIPLVRSAIQHLASLGSTEEYPLYLDDRDKLVRLATTEEWTDEDKRTALLLFAKYRRILIRDGFDYYAVFPKNKYNHDLEDRVKKVYGFMDYLQKTHNIKPPFGFDLMPVDDVEKWVRNKIIEVRILNAQRSGTAAK